MILFDESLKESILRMREQCLAKWLQSMLGSIADEIIPSMAKVKEVLMTVIKA